MRRQQLSLLLILPLLINCKKVVKLIDVNEFLFSGALEFNDLSHPFDNDTFCIPGTKQISFSKESGGTRMAGSWFTPDDSCKSEFGGTKINAPFNYAEGQWAVGMIPYRNLITPLIVVDLNNYVAGNPDFVLEKRHMDYLFHGDERRNFTVLFRFGWSQHFGNKEKYLGGSHVSQYKYPGISEDVAQWISANRYLIGVAVDTPSVDPGSDHRGRARSVFANHKIFIVENVNIDKDLPRTQCAIMIMPVKFEDQTAAPCRINAICPKLMGHTLF